MCIFISAPFSLFACCGTFPLSQCKNCSRTTILIRLFVISQPEATPAINKDQVFVLGESDEEIRRHVRAIQQAYLEGGTRGFNGDEAAFRGNENRGGVLQRVAGRQARPVLWKVFRSGVHCNLMSEIWIEDKANPEAKGDRCKDYVIVHVHHHKTVESARDLQQLLTEFEWNEKTNLMVDAVNARHLLRPDAPAKHESQFDNPFYEQKGHTYFSSAIEQSGGSTLKVFPQQKTWRCECNYDNKSNWAKCLNTQCSAENNKRPHSAWDWDVDGGQDQGLALLFKYAHAEASQWLGGGAKDRLRGKEGSSDACYRTLADVQKFEAQVSVERTAVGLFIGIDEYKKMQRLCHCYEDAKAMCSGMKQAAGGAALCSEVNEGDTPIGFMELQEKLDDFRQVACQLPSPQLLFFYFAGHGIRQSGQDHLLASDYVRGTIGALEVSDLVMALCPPELDNTEKFFVLDCCRLTSPDEPVARLGRERPSNPDFPPLNTVVVFATRAGSSADDGSQKDAHGPFCRALLGDESEGLFSSSFERFSGNLQGACTRYSRNRVKDGKAGADNRGTTDNLVRLGDLRAKAEESLRQAVSGDLLRCSKLTTRASMDMEVQLEAELQGQPFLRPTEKVPETVSVCKERSSEYEKGVQDFVPEGEPLELDRVRLCAFALDSDLSAAETCSETNSCVDDDDDEILVTCSEEVTQAVEALRKLESVLSQWVDDMLDDLWGDLEQPLCPTGQQEITEDVEEIVSKWLQKSGMVCDPQMSRKLKRHVLNELADDERDQLAEKSLRLCAEKADFLLRIQERARQTYFRVRCVAETGSFTASLEAPKWVAAVLHILLSKYESFRSTVLELGFHKFLLTGTMIELKPSQFKTQRYICLPLNLCCCVLLIIDTALPLCSARDALCSTQIEQVSGNVAGLKICGVLPDPPTEEYQSDALVAPQAVELSVKGLPPQYKDSYISAMSTSPAARTFPTSHSALRDSSVTFAGDNKDHEEEGVWFRGARVELPGYSLVEKLGRGAQGHVWKAIEAEEGEAVAVKLSTGKLTQHEAAILARVSHPNVVRVRRFIPEEEAGGKGYTAIVMDYVAGQRLDTFALNWGGCLPEGTAVNITLQLLKGLEALHSSEPLIIHRDVKPSNIMIVGEANDMKVIIVDLGVSKELREAAALRADELFQTAVAQTVAGLGVGPRGFHGATIFDEGLLVGTLPYWSLEQAQWQEDLDVREDLWAVGVVLFELVVGQLPFMGATKKEILRNIVNQDVWHADVQDISQQMRFFLQKALNKDRQKRFQTCFGMRVGLNIWVCALTNFLRFWISVMRRQ